MTKNTRILRSEAEGTEIVVDEVVRPKAIKSAKDVINAMLYSIATDSLMLSSTAALTLAGVFIAALDKGELTVEQIQQQMGSRYSDLNEPDVVDEDSVLISAWPGHPEQKDTDHKALLLARLGGIPMPTEQKEKIQAFIDRQSKVNIEMFFNRLMPRSAADFTKGLLELATEKGTGVDRKFPSKLSVEEVKKEDDSNPF